MSPAKTAEPIEMPFDLRTQVGPKNHVLDGGPDPLKGRGKYEGERGVPLQSIRTLSSHLCKGEPIEMPFGLWARTGRRNHVLDGGPEMLRDVAMATNFGTKIAINWLYMNDSD